MKSVQDIIKMSRQLIAKRSHDANYELLRRARSHYPENAHVQLEFAFASAERNKEHGVVEARHLLGMSPLPWDVELRCGYLLLNLGCVDEARKCVEHLNGVVPDSWELTFQLVQLGGRIAHARGQCELAEGLLRTAYEGEPEYASHGVHLARLLREQGRLDEALAILGEGLGSFPDDEEWLALNREIDDY